MSGAKSIKNEVKKIMENESQMFQTYEFDMRIGIVFDEQASHIKIVLLRGDLEGLTRLPEDVKMNLVKSLATVFMSGEALKKLGLDSIELENETHFVASNKYKQ